MLKPLSRLDALEADAARYRKRPTYVNATTANLQAILERTRRSIMQMIEEPHLYTVGHSRTLAQKEGWIEDELKQRGRL